LESSTPLVAANDSAVTSGNTAVTINVLSNDTDAVGAINPASVAAVSNPSDGSLSINSSNGQITYTPVAGFFGTDSFTYNFKDNNGLTSNTATVSVNVNPIEIMYTLLGDANLDGKVNGTDFTILATNFNQSVTDGWDKGDFNYDGKVNGSDFLALATNFNQSAGQSAVSVTTSNTSTAENPVPRTTFAAAGAPPSTLAPISDDGSNDVNAAILNHRGKKKTSH
jgi:hypothetical protein